MQNLTVVLFYRCTMGLCLHRDGLGYVRHSIGTFIIAIGKAVQTDQIEIEERTQRQSLSLDEVKVLFRTGLLKFFDVGQQGVDLQDAVVAPAPEA